MKRLQKSSSEKQDTGLPPDRARQSTIPELGLSSYRQTKRNEGDECGASTLDRSSARDSTVSHSLREGLPNGGTVQLEDLEKALLVSNNHLFYYSSSGESDPSEADRIASDHDSPKRETTQPRLSSNADKNEVIVFDHHRMNSLDFHDLQSPQDCLSFMTLVQDYINYLRCDVVSGKAEVEERSLNLFIEMVSNEVGFPLARQVVAEFRDLEKPSPSAPKRLQELLRRLQIDLLPSSIDLRSRHIPQYERELQWQRLRNCVSWLSPNDTSSNEFEGVMDQIASLSQERRLSRPRCYSRS